MVELANCPDIVKQKLTDLLQKPTYSKEDLNFLSIRKKRAEICVEITELANCPGL